MDAVTHAQRKLDIAASIKEAEEEKRAENNKLEKTTQKQTTDIIAALEKAASRVPDISLPSLILNTTDTQQQYIDSVTQSLSDAFPKGPQKKRQLYEEIKKSTLFSDMKERVWNAFYQKAMAVCSETASIAGGTVTGIGINQYLFPSTNPSWGAALGAQTPGTRHGSNATLWLGAHTAMSLAGGALTGAAARGILSKPLQHQKDDFLKLFDHHLKNALRVLFYQQSQGRCAIPHRKLPSTQ